MALHSDYRNATYSVQVSVLFVKVYLELFHVKTSYVAKLYPVRSSLFCHPATLFWNLLPQLYSALNCYGIIVYIMYMYSIEFVIIIDVIIAVFCTALWLYSCRCDDIFIRFDLLSVTYCRNEFYVQFYKTKRTTTIPQWFKAIKMNMVYVISYFLYSTR